MRSKPDLVDQPERTAHYDCATRMAEMLPSTGTVLLISPFLQTNITVQMTPMEVGGGVALGLTVASLMSRRRWHVVGAGRSISDRVYRQRRVD